MTFWHPTPTGISHETPYRTGQHQTPSHINAYTNETTLASPLDRLADVIVHLGFLVSADYTVNLVRSEHGVTASEAKNRQPSVAAYVRAARAFLDQAQSGPELVSFLPAYYAMLNLAKVCILFLSKHAELPPNRWHGASYDGYGKASHSLVTETVTLRSAGAIPLFYSAITGRTVRDKTRIAMRDVYPYISGIGAEWLEASGDPWKLRAIRFFSTATAHVPIVVRIDRELIPERLDMNRTGFLGECAAVVRVCSVQPAAYVSGRGGTVRPRGAGTPLRRLAQAAVRV